MRTRRTLVDDTAVSGLEDRFQFRAGIMDRTAVVLALDVLRNKVHGPRPVEGDACDDIFKVLRAQFLHEPLHTAGLQLENTVGPAGGNVAVDIGIRVVESVHGD